MRDLSALGRQGQKGQERNGLREQSPELLGKTGVTNVETEAQQEFLTRLGCNSLQGFLLGRPMPAEQLLASVA